MTQQGKFNSTSIASMFKDLSAAKILTVKALALCVFFGGCGGGSEQPAGPNADRGRRLYLANCVVCHNREPSKDGPTGPAIAGSSETLLRYRVLSRSYPPGYVPKRKSSAMPTYPHLKKAIPDLAAYLDPEAQPSLQKDLEAKIKDKGQDETRP